MLRCLSFYVVILAVVSTSYALEPKLPPEAKVTRPDDGKVLISLSGNADSKSKIRREMLEQIASLPTLIELDLRFSDVSDEVLEPLKNAHSLKALDLAFSNVTGESLGMLSKLPNIQYLRLDACKVNDDHLTTFSDMPQLVLLRLGRTQVTDKGLPAIGKLPNLRTLDLRDCAVTDRGLPSLGRMKQLCWLYLSKTIRYWKGDRSQLTDASVDYLSTVKSLKRLDIAASQMTDERLSRLREALPKLEIDTKFFGAIYPENYPRKKQP